MGAYMYETLRGVVSVLSFNGKALVEKQRLRGPGTPMNGNQFGYSLALGGKYLAVGEPGKALGSISYAGAVDIYKKSAGKWALMQTLTAADAVDEWFLGYSLAMSKVGSQSVAHDLNCYTHRVDHRLRRGTFMRITPTTT